MKDLCPTPFNEEFHLIGMDSIFFFYLRKSLCVVGLELLIKLFLANQFIALFKSYQGIVTEGNCHGTTWNKVECQGN